MKFDIDEPKVFEMLKSSDVDICILALKLISDGGLRYVVDYFDRYGDADISSKSNSVRWITKRCISSTVTVETHWIYHRQLNLYFTVSRYGIAPWEYVGKVGSRDMKYVQI